MKAIEKYLNILHFCFYKAHYKSYLFNKKLSLSRLLFKIPAIKNKAKKYVANLDETLDTAFKNKYYGLSMTVAGGILLGMLFFFFWGVINFLIGKPEGLVSLTTPHILISIILSVALSYIFVFRNDKYIEYFDRYEKWSETEKRKYSWVTFASIVVVLLLFYLGITT